MHECGGQRTTLGSALPFHLYMDSRDLIQVARLAWLRPIPGKLSHQFSTGPFQTSLKVVTQVLLSPPVLL